MKTSNLLSKPLLMTTREIADLTGKPHTDVLRDFKAACVTLKLDAHCYRTISAGGKPKRMFNVTRDLAFTLLWSYSADLALEVDLSWVAFELAQAAYARNGSAQ